MYVAVKPGPADTIRFDDERVIRFFRAASRPLPVDDAEHQLQVLCDARSLTALQLIGYANARPGTEFAACPLASRTMKQAAVSSTEAARGHALTLVLSSYLCPVFTWCRTLEMRAHHALSWSLLQALFIIAKPLPAT